MTTETTPSTAASFNLWHRRNRREPWAIFATGASERELTPVMATSGKSGDFETLAAGEHPDDRQRRRAGA